MRSAHNRKFEDSSLQAIERGGLLPDRPTLTKKQIEFLQIYTASPFLPDKEVCRQVGINVGHLKKWKKRSDGFNKALTTEQNRSRQVMNMKRESVMRGMLEAVDMAKDQRQPGTMISGWKEIGRMCGFYEPERREVVWAVGGQELVEQIQNLPKQKLIELVSQADALEAEFEVVDEELQN
jgi:hypothetical protein